MRDLYRLIATIVIWVMFTGITIAMLTSSTGVFERNTGDLVPVMAILAAAATLSTISVWAGPEMLARTPHTSADSLTKRKREQRERMSRLVQDLNDDDVYELEALLLAREDAAEQRTRQG